MLHSRSGILAEAVNTKILTKNHPGFSHSHPYYPHLHPYSPHSHPDFPAFSPRFVFFILYYTSIQISYLQIYK